MVRKAFKMKVYGNELAEYKKRHNPIWPELESLLKKQGVQSYSIFHDPETNILFAYAEIESEEKWSKIAEFEICQKWWKSMQDLMETNKDSSPKSSNLNEVFHLD